MRVLFLISGLKIGGAETQAIRLTRALSMRGHYVGLHVLSEHAERLGEIDPKLVRCVVDPRQGKFDFQLIRRIRQRIDHEKIDVVVSFLFDANIYARLACIGTNVKVINTERSSNYVLGKIQTLAHWLTLWRVDTLIANSHAGRHHAVDILGYPSERCTTIWNGIDVLSNEPAHSARTHVDESLIKLPTRDMKTRRLCIVGRLLPVKDHALAIQTLEKLRLMAGQFEDWHLIIVGGEALGYPDYLNELKELIASLNLSEVIYFTGESRCVEHILNQVDLVISTSHHEGFPNVVLEAMQVSKPVVATNYSDVQQILPYDWQVVHTRDPIVLAEAVLQVMQRRGQVVAKQIEVLCSHFTTEKMVDQYESILSRLVGVGLPAVALS